MTSALVKPGGSSSVHLIETPSRRGRSPRPPVVLFVRACNIGGDTDGGTVIPIDAITTASAGSVMIEVVTHQISGLRVFVSVILVLEGAWARGRGTGVE